MFRSDPSVMLRCALLVSSAAALFATAPAGSQTFPAPGRLVTIVVPFSLGTGPDILARLTGQKLGERWGNPFIVDNKPGASGNIGKRLANPPCQATEIGRKRRQVDVLPAQIPRHERIEVFGPGGG